MRGVRVHGAKPHLSKLQREVEAGSEVVFLRGGKAVERLVPVRGDAARVLGGDRGAFVVPNDLDAPLPGSLLDAFES